MTSKIIIVTDAWHPQVNGVVTALQKTIDLLEKRNFEVSVIHPNLFSSIAFPLYPEIKISLFSKKKVAYILEKEKPNFIHIATEGILGIAARKYCIKKSIPFTTSYHTHFPYYLEYYIKIKNQTLINIAYSYLRWFHNKASTIMVASESLRHELDIHGLKNIKLWPLGVDTDLFKKNKNAIPETFGLSKPLFTYFGRVSEEKNLEEFLRCTLPGTKLIIGDGPARKKLETNFRDKALFLGYKRGQELVDLLSISDVFVFPSYTETFGLTIIEAMACELSVAAHSVMGPIDIVTSGVDGILSTDIQQAAINCLKLSGPHCREKALTFSWEKSVEAFIRNLISI